MRAEWNLGIGRMITALGTSQVPSELVAALKTSVEFDYAVMFA